MTAKDIPEDLFKMAQTIFSVHSHKVRQWFFVDNPKLGGLSPMEMLRLGREDRLRQLLAPAYKDICTELRDPSYEG